MFASPSTSIQSSSVRQSSVFEGGSRTIGLSSGVSVLKSSSAESKTRIFYQPEITQYSTRTSSLDPDNSLTGQIDGQVSASVSGPMSALTSETASKSVSASTSSSTEFGTAAASSPNVNFKLSTYEAVIQRSFTHATYFAAVFLPALIAVVLKSLWNVVASSLRMIEPFQRLLGGRNVTAKDSLLTQYLEGAISQDAIQSIKRGRLLPICALLIYAMVQVLPLIGAISMSVKTRKVCLWQGEDRPCDPVWVLNVPLMRLLEAFFFIAVALVICLIWLTRGSGIPVASNPSSIISLASLLNHEPLLLSLQKIDPDADTKLFEAALKKKVFGMAEHYDLKSKQTRFGFVSSQTVHQRDDSYESKPYQPLTTPANLSHAYAPVRNPPDINEPKITARRSRLSPISRMWIEATLSFLNTLGLLAILVTYLLDTNLNDAFNRFFNGDSVPPIVSKTVFVRIAILVDMQMKNLDRRIRITDPFRRLALRNARAETTVLLTLNGTCWSNLPQNLYLLFRYEFSEGRMAWATFVSLIACLSDINIIAVAGFLFNDAQTREAYYICAKLSIACTSAILLAVLVTMGWWLRVPVIRRMPRQPDTIGNILSYLCGSELVKDWNDVGALTMPPEYMGRKERDALVVRDERRYCFGRLLGVDERERWTVDYERDQSQVMVVPKHF